MTIKKGLEIFCGVTVLAICLLIIFTTNVRTLQALRSIDIRFLIFSLILICLSWCFDVLRLKVLTKAAGVRLPFMYGTKAILSYTFLSNITPSSAGGEPILFYMLNQKGITFGKASAIVFLRTMITMVFFAIGGPIIIYFHRELLSSVGLKMVFDYVAIFLAVTVMFFTYLYFAPHSARKGLDLLFNYFEKFVFFKGKSSRLKYSLLHVVDEFKSSLMEFLQGERWRLILVIFYTALMIVAQFLVAPMLLKGLGCDVGMLSTFMVQGVLNFMLYYVPTPGGSGISEGVGYALFAPLVPSHILGVFLVIWKFLTNYVWTIVGGLIIVKSIGMKHLEDLTIERKKELV
ncbi:MAG: hypothetical protein A2069_07715 [Planctomycetes bacterium GWB2_41_19]|nr:MAG: hypothetical protein A2069_07715 [Planctomycetes bacterium GWB2_41_19]